MNTPQSLKKTGSPSLEELREKGALPSAEQLQHKARVCIECIEEIPCNPCETSCPQHALHVGSPITNLPEIDQEACTTCGKCIPACPGLAITIKSIHGDKARIRFPWEYLPLPKPGETVCMADRQGEKVCEGTIVSAINPVGNNHTAVICAEYPASFLHDVITIRRVH